MKKEIKALEKNETQIIESLLPGKKPISCKWVYRVKYNLDGMVARWKAHLMI